MTRMDSFVDLTYRGLQLGRRIKLTAVRPSTGYLELPTPMPVGTAIAILTDETVALEAMVVEIHEQVGGSDRVPGMVVRPKLEADAANKWWQARVALPELEPRPARPASLIPQPPIVASVVVQKRVLRDTQVHSAVPELVEEGHDTSVMDAVDLNSPAFADSFHAGPSVVEAVARPSNPGVQDDGKPTTMMEAVDLAALGLDPTTTSGRFPTATISAQIAAVKLDEDEDDDPDKKPTAAASATKKKRKKR